MPTSRDLIAPLADNGRGILLFDEFLESQHYGLPVDEFHWAIEDPDLGLLELTCDNGYIVTEYDLGFPDVREVTYDRPLNDGTFDLTRYVGSRLVSLTIVLNGDSNPFFPRSNAASVRTSPRTPTRHGARSCRSSNPTGRSDGASSAAARSREPRSRNATRT